MFNALSLTCSAPSSGSVGISRRGEAASGGSPVPLLADRQPSTITHPDPSRYLRGRRGARRPRRPRSPPFPALRGPGAAGFLKCGQVAVAGSPLALPGAAHCSKHIVCSWLMVQIFCPELSHAAPAYMYLKKKNAVMVSDLRHRSWKGTCSCIASCVHAACRPVLGPSPCT